MKYIISLVSLTFILLISDVGYSQTSGGNASSQNEYDQDHIKERSAKSHKKAGKVAKQNTKAQEHANKIAEKNRKEKLSGKRKEEDAHQFPH